MADIHDLSKFQKEQQQKGQSSQPQVTRQDVMDAPDVGCARCGGQLFIPAFRFKRLSKLLTGEAEDRHVQLQTMVCASCGLELGSQPKEEDPIEEGKTSFDE